MARYVLMLSGGSDADRFEVPPSGLVLGRSPEVDIVLTGPAVSRRHAHVWLEGDALFVEDLGSRNGVEINGEITHLGRLDAGDRLGVGDTLFEVVKHQAIAAGRSVIGYDQGSTLCQRIVTEDTARFPLLYRATQLLGTVFDLDELFTKILELIFDALPVRRGFILTLARDSNEPELRATLSREPDKAAPPLSRTLVDHVIGQRDAIMTLDAQYDRRFQTAQSVVSHAIRAAMCAPLCGRTAVVGAIYVDSGAEAGSFTEQDLQLLTVIGRVVGEAVENAQLHREMIERERLAALGEAMAGVGHCVKNILTAIRGGGHFIDRGVAESEIEFVGKGWPMLRRAMERIDMLVMNMLSFAHNPEPQRIETDIDVLCREVLGMVRTRADKLNITLEYEPCGGATAWVDERQLYRVLLNLLTNAVDACERTGGAVWVSSTCDTSGCTIKVRDSGPGVPPDILPKLSRAFVSSKGSNGVGLGLACSYKIVRAHGGDILVESTPGEGATFSVVLPSETGIRKRR
ncbi:MAG: FHA domain-containing protein [Nitrospiraceae bacterium]|nr:FHA domain-containing protein [Nitrospiraceae bacterium]